MRAGAGGDDLAVDDIDIPPCFVVLRGVAGIAQRQTEVQRFLLMQRVCRLDSRIEHMRGIEHDPRIDRGPHRQIRMQALNIDQLIGRFFIGDVNIRDGKEIGKQRPPGDA